MSTQSVNSPPFSADGANPDPSSDAAGTEVTATAHVQVTGRNVEIPDHFRVYVGHKLARA